MKKRWSKKTDDCITVALGIVIFAVIFLFVPIVGDGPPGY